MLWSLERDRYGGAAWGYYWCRWCFGRRCLRQVFQTGSNTRRHVSLAELRPVLSAVIEYTNERGREQEPSHHAGDLPKHQGHR